MSNLARSFSTTDLQAIHDASMALLARHGLVIKDDALTEFFRHRGFSVDGHRIKITETQVRTALETVPSRFTIQARNPEHDAEVGGADPVLSCTGGPTLILDPDGTVRDATLADYRKFCKLIQSSKVPQVLSHEMVHPMDGPAQTSHLDMFYEDVTLCDRALTGNTLDTTTTRDTLDLLALIFGGLEKIQAATFSINVVNPLSPLAFAPDQAEALKMLAEHNQAVAITNMILLGSTAPVDLASALALGNAEILAGVVLSQLARPGAPVVYGSTSCPLEMKSGVAALGKPETLLYAQATAGLARFYQIPSRLGGALTDAHLVDAQAGFESALMLKTALDNGVDYVLHTFGMMSSYLAASLEKFVVDEEIARLLLAARRETLFDPRTIDVDYLVEMGAGGNYLGSPRTFKSFRQLYQSGFLGAQSPNAWRERGSKTAAEAARAEVEARLRAFTPPPLDQGLHEALQAWIDRRKKELL